MSYSPYITVAASNSIFNENDDIDFVCSGKNDELVINQAINAAAESKKGIYFLNGNYSIDGFYDFGDGGPMAAIRTPALYKELELIGQTSPFTQNHEGVEFDVSEEALATIENGEYSVFRTQWKENGLYSGSILKLENFVLALAHNQKAVRCIDLRRCDRVQMKNVFLSGKSQNTYLGVADRAVEGCIGLTMTDGSNNFIVRYDNVSASDFYEGIQVGGEHVVMINCAAVHSVYGYTFGNYGFHCGYNHPITMINCCDERNVNLPLFNLCGDHARDGSILIGGQEVSMISFNIERLASQTPGGKLGDAMREIHPGAFCGRIEYTLQPDWNHTNETNFKLFENGSGVGFRTINMTHKTVCSTAERLSYYPSLGQQIFDTDLNKLLICVDADTKKWVDANGCEVD
ncbi:MAG: hypothetical protein IKJ91_09635 [Clostridia bacterium]|nr:hypothetical protein [Clostridia bacterium]